MLVRCRARCFDTATFIDAHIDNHGARLHALHHLFGDQHRGRAPRDQRGANGDVLFRERVGEHLRLLFLVLVRHFLRITTGSFRFFEFFILDRNELSTE